MKSGGLNTQTSLSLSRCVGRRLHITEEIAVRAEHHHILVALEAILVSAQATNEGIEVRILAECISKQFRGFGITFTAQDTTLALRFRQRLGDFIVRCRAQFFRFFLTL